MADFFAPVEPEREDLEVECRECRQTLRASSAVIRETMATSTRGVRSVRRCYYCSEACAEQLSVESSSAATVESDGGETEQRDSYMLVPSMEEHPTRHEAVGELALSDDDRIAVVKQPEFTQMMRGDAR